MTSTPLNREMIALEGIGTLEGVALQSESTAFEGIYTLERMDTLDRTPLKTLNQTLNSLLN